MKKFDAIILGSGHNGLVLQAYLARCGLRTLCIERSEQLGGGLTTKEMPKSSGFRHNLHSFYHRAIDQMPWFSELELERHGVSYLEPDENVALITKDNRAIVWSTDFETTYKSIAAFSQTDADQALSWRQKFQPILQQIVIPEMRAPPVHPDERRKQLESSPVGQSLLDVAALSPLEFVDREFEHPTVKAALLFFNGLREVDLRCRGFGHHIPSLLASERLAQMCKGGSASLAQALCSVISQHGGELRTSAIVSKVLVRGQKVAGVVLEDGEVIDSRIVVSSLNPHQSFLELLPENALNQEWKQKATNFRYNLLAPLFSLHLNLREPPKYSADVKNPLMVILGLDDSIQFQEIVECHEQGRVPQTVMWGSCPSAFDPTQAPPGRHTAFMWEKLPYRLHGDASNWLKEKESHGQQMLEMWSRYAPNLRDHVEFKFTQSPLEVERSLPNMREADLLIGAFTHGQVGYNRPFPGAGHYRTHLPGYYLCGSCCHPGGNITGLPGYNCVQVVLADLKMEPSPPR